MGWAEHRIEEYRHGAPASWLERRMLDHANPVHFAVAWAAAIGFVYGLWAHDWPWVIGSTALALAGHVYAWAWHDRGAPHAPAAGAGGRTPAGAV